MMTFPLLETKFFIPPQPGGRGVSRPRLLRRLDEGVRRGRRLTLVSAPAGSGKTTLLSEWVRARSEEEKADVAWLALDRADDAPLRFWTYFVAALGRARKGLGETALAALGSAGRVDAEPLLTALLNQVAASPTPLVLVLDDYHLISTRAIHEGLAFLLAHQPPQWHLVVSTRVDPPLPVVRLRARGQLTELRAEDLNFTADEAEAFLNRVMGLALSPREVDALGARTEGWAVGLQLAALSMQGRADTRAFIVAFTGSHHYVLEYLTREVLARQPAPVQRFLVHTAILERLCGPLCDALMAQVGGVEFPAPESPLSGHERLAQLAAANLFLVPLDDARRWYRYHPLFADLLRQRLIQERAPAYVQALHRRASAWYEQHGGLEEAVGHALAAGDSARVADIAERAVQANRLDSRLTTLLRWVDGLSDSVRQARPRLGIYQAWALFLNGHIERGRRMLDLAGQDLVGLSDAPTRQELGALLEAVQATLQGLVYSISGQVDQAIPACRTARERASATGHLLLVAQATEGLALAQFYQGRLRASAETCRQVLALAQEAGEGALQAPLAAAGHVDLAGLCREWNDLAAAAQHLDEALALCRRGGTTQTLVEAYIVRARLCQDRGDLAGAREALRQARQFSLMEGAYSVVNFKLSLQEARLDLAQGALGAVDRWTQPLEARLDAEDRSRPVPSALRAAQRMMRVRLHLAREAPEAALEILAPLLEAAEADGRLGQVVEICWLQALALQATGDAAVASAAVERSLALAAPEGYARMYLDEGAPAAALLRAFCRTETASPRLRRYAQGLLDAFGAVARGQGQADASPAATREALPDQGALVEPLTRREIEVLRLIYQGYSNQEIAEALVIALNTVKNHTSHIYGKLGVSSRTQAVARALALDLL